MSQTQFYARGKKRKKEPTAMQRSENFINKRQFDTQLKEKRYQDSRLLIVVTSDLPLILPMKDHLKFPLNSQQKYEKIRKASPHIFV